MGDIDDIHEKLRTIKDVFYIGCPIEKWFSECEPCCMKVFMKYFYPKKTLLYD